MVSPLQVQGQENAQGRGCWGLVYFKDSVAEGVAEAGLAVHAEEMTLAGVEAHLT